MRILVICKASTSIGFGHLIRSKTLSRGFINIGADIDLDLVIIGNSHLEKFTEDDSINYSIIRSEHDLYIDEFVDVCFLDMTEIDSSVLQQIKMKTGVIASLSPVFNKMSEVDIFINRTKYLSPENNYGNANIHAGLEYALVQENCIKITAGTYEESLTANHFSIAISMGGGDATNKTLLVLEALKKCRVPATFWVMLGEGYQHSFDALINEISKDSLHEIILAKTNRSMWQILKNCVLAILPGGITTYEAAYAGLPTINFFEDEQQQFLIKELVEREVCLNVGVFGKNTLHRLSETVEGLYTNRQKLMQMHINSKNLIDNHGAARILKVCSVGIAK